MVFVVSTDSAALAGSAASSVTVLDELLDEEDEELSLPAPALLGTLDLISLAASALVIDKPTKSPKNEVSVYLKSSSFWSRTLSSQARPRVLSHWALVAALGGGGELALVVGDELLNLDEGVGLEDSSRGRLAALGSVAVDVLPHVVNGVEKCGAAQGGATASRFVSVVVLHGDLVILADHLKSPVVVPVTAGGEVWTVLSIHCERR